VVSETVAWVALIVVTTANVALWAVRPNHYSTGRLARRWMGTCTVAWAIMLPAAGAAALVLGGASGVSRSSANQPAPLATYPVRSRVTWTPDSGARLDRGEPRDRSKN
jgi:hypothetical protein